jgi:uncharacterized protein
LSLSAQLGRVVHLTVARKTEFGYFLTDGNDEVMMHKNESKREYTEEEDVEVFLYPDAKGRIAATDAIPFITVNHYGWAQVTEVKPGIGVFLNIGIKKELLLGEEDLPSLKSVWPIKGDMLFTTIRISRNNRMYARLASEKVIAEIAAKATKKDFNKNVHGYIYRTAKVGSWIYTAEGFKGFIHESQREKEPRLGEKVEGRIIDVKVDGSINVSLLARKHETLDQDAERIFAFLQSRNGAMPYSDKSKPDDIMDRFNMSKGAFKRALGRLMKDGKIYQEEGWTYMKK